MPLISSRYWNMVHGQSPNEVRIDIEGMRKFMYVSKEYGLDPAL